MGGSEGVQRANAHTIASPWGIDLANQCRDRCRLIASQDEDCRANCIKGVYGESYISSKEPNCEIII